MPTEDATNERYCGYLTLNKGDFVYGMHARLGGFEFIPALMLILHDMALYDVSLSSRRPAAGATGKG